MRNVMVGGALVVFGLGCNESRVCTAMGCGPPFVVAVDIGDYDMPTTVEVVADGEAVTLECPPPGEPRQVVRCEPSEAEGQRFFFIGEVGNTDRRFVDVSVTQQGDPIGPREAHVVIRSGSDVLFEESFEAEYGKGREINGPGCGRCYGPVIFDRSLDVPDEQDGG